MVFCSSSVRSDSIARHEVVRSALCMCIGLLLETTAAVGQTHGPDPLSPDQIAVQQAQIQNSLIEQLPLGIPAQDDTDDASESSGSSTSRVDLPGLGKTAMSLGLVVGLIVALSVGIRFVARRGQGIMAAMGPAGRAPAGVLEILGRYPISRGQTLVLLKIDRRILLLCQGSGVRMGAGLTTLCEIVDPEEVASILLRTRDEDGDSISDRFRSALHRFDRPETDPLERPSNARRTLTGVEGDVAELWDDKSGALIDISSAGYGSVGSLRRRLAKLRQREGLR